MVWTFITHTYIQVVPLGFLREEGIRKMTPDSPRVSLLLT